MKYEDLEACRKRLKQMVLREDQIRGNSTPLKDFDTISIYAKDFNILALLLKAELDKHECQQPD